MLVRAHAKINLVLDLLGPRDDGYTEIATVFQSVSLADELEIEVRPGVADVVLEVAGAAPCPPQDNLALRAAWAFLRRTGAAATVRIRLRKEIPAGGGLGGGSSDAAAVLRALDTSLAPGLAPAELDRLGAGLGADVPFFLHGGLAIGRGRGDQIEELPDLPPLALVLVHPGFSLSTAEVFREARAGLTTRSGPPNIRKFQRYLRGSRGDLPPLGNDLLRAAGALRPEIHDLLSALERLGGQAGMTGSGSTVYSLFPEEAAAANAARAMSGVPNAWVRTARTVTRAVAVGWDGPSSGGGGGRHGDHGHPRVPGR
ncbi:MAG: 4-(cytidine 5'-diphospho)-2-C-methyl-D-erythritol kinase [Acidobacteria bacterium]|nr:4-(cytidine 5'-diphospho)-2-C-methyl-D-erythritol kinase [Acidobacteriota bacterium]